MMKGNSKRRITQHVVLGAKKKNTEGETEGGLEQMKQQSGSW